MNEHEHDHRPGFDQSRFAWAGVPDDWDDIRPAVEERLDIEGRIRCERLA